MPFLLEGRARRLGDAINTDYLIASSRKKETLDPELLKQYLLERVHPGFAASVRPGDLLVAGRNFGCGSAMEVAVTVLQAAGIAAVLAQSFARSFYRNAVNNGLLPVVCDTSGIEEWDQLQLSGSDAGLAVVNLRNGVELAAEPLPRFMLEVLEAGGLVPFMLRRRGSWSLGPSG